MIIDSLTLVYLVTLVFAGSFLFWMKRTKSGRKWLEEL